MCGGSFTSTQWDRPRLLLVRRLNSPTPPPFFNLHDTRNVHGRPVSFGIAHLPQYIHPPSKASSIVRPSNEEHRAVAKETIGWAPHDKIDVPNLVTCFYRTRTYEWWCTCITLFRSITVFSLNVGNIRKCFVECCQCHKTLLWIWIMVCGWVHMI